MNIELKNCEDAAMRKNAISLFNHFETENLATVRKFGYDFFNDEILKGKGGLKIKILVKKNKITLKPV